MSRTKHSVAAVAAIVLCATSAHAGQVRFNPLFELQAGATDNVEYVGSRETSDTTLTLAAELPVERSWDGGSLELSYRPSYVTHADADVLDRDEHRLDLRSSTRVGRLASLTAAAGWYKRQEQGGTRFDEADTFEDRDPFLTERSDRESSWASLSFDRDQAPRWRWSAGLGWASYDHDAIDDLAVDPFDPADPNRVEDRTEVGASFQLSRQVSRRSAIGLELAHREFELDVSGDEQSDLFGITFDHEASRSLSLSLTLGAARQSFDNPAFDESTEVQGALSLTRTFRTVALDLAATHRPDVGGHLAGSATNSSFAVTLGNAVDRSWNWDASLRFKRREPTDSTDQTRDATALGLGAERRFGPTLGLALGVSWVDQTSDLDSDRSAAGASAGLRWYPRGRAVTARGDDS